VSSFRTADQIANSGWWASLFTAGAARRTAIRIDSAEEQDDGSSSSPAICSRPAMSPISAGAPARANRAYEPGEVADMGDGERLTVPPTATTASPHHEEVSGRAASGSSPRPTTPPEFTLENYASCCSRANSREGMAKAFFNTLTVTIPATSFRS
jgi:alpha-glucoside transport system permease protein